MNRACMSKPRRMVPFMKAVIASAARPVGNGRPGLATGGRGTGGGLAQGQLKPICLRVLYVLEIVGKAQETHQSPWPWLPGSVQCPGLSTTTLWAESASREIAPPSVSSSWPATTVTHASSGFVTHTNSGLSPSQEELPAEPFPRSCSPACCVAGGGYKCPRAQGGVTCTLRGAPSAKAAQAGRACQQVPGVHGGFGAKCCTPPPNHVRTLNSSGTISGSFK